MGEGEEVGVILQKCAAFYEMFSSIKNLQFRVNIKASCTYLFNECLNYCFKIDYSNWKGNFDGSVLYWFPGSGRIVGDEPTMAMESTVSMMI